MKKKSIGGLLFIAVFGLLGVGCCVCCWHNHVLFLYGLGFLSIAAVLNVAE